MFNSKGDNLGQREIQVEFETVWWGFMIKLWSYSQTSAQDFGAVQNVICQVQSEF